MSEDSSSSLLSSFIPFLTRSLTIVGALVAAFGGFLYLKQDSLLYFPEIGGIPRHNKDNPRGYRSPGERQVPFEDHQIKCEDGVVIHAWLLQRGDPDKPTVLFFHGNAGNIGLRLPNALQMLQFLDANIFMVEYRGYGDSDSVPPSEAGLRLDAEAALKHLHANTNVNKSKIFVFGRSLGGAVAFHLAEYAQMNNIPLAGVICENTFTSISAMVDKLMPFLTPIKPFVLKIGWNSSKIVPNLRLPILFIAGSKDELVPHEHMQQLYKSSTQSSLVELYVVEGGTHNETWVQGGHAYWEKFKGFMEQALRGEHQRSTYSSSAGGHGQQE